jgi:hypothetical protein
MASCGRDWDDGRPSILMEVRVMLRQLEVSLRCWHPSGQAIKLNQPLAVGLGEGNIAAELASQDAALFQDEIELLQVISVSGQEGVEPFQELRHDGSFGKAGGGRPGLRLSKGRRVFASEVLGK